MTKLTKLLTQKDIIETELQCCRDSEKIDPIAQFDPFTMKIEFLCTQVTPREMDRIVEWYNDLMRDIEPVNIMALETDF
jgi:hypothetical protein